LTITDIIRFGGDVAGLRRAEKICAKVISRFYKWLATENCTGSPANRFDFLIGKRKIFSHQRSNDDDDDEDKSKNLIPAKNSSTATKISSSTIPSVFLGEVGELGFSLLHWPSGPSEVFSQIVDVCFSDHICYKGRKNQCRCATVNKDDDDGHENDDTNSSGDGLPNDDDGMNMQ